MKIGLTEALEESVLLILRYPIPILIPIAYPFAIPIPIAIYLPTLGLLLVFQLECN